MSDRAKADEAIQEDPFVQGVEIGRLLVYLEALPHRGKAYVEALQYTKPQHVVS